VERNRAAAATAAEAEAAAARALDEDRLLRQDQENEFQQSLLMDQLKDQIAAEECLQREADALEVEIDECEKIHGHATQRLERFGENPRFVEEASRAAERLDSLRAKLDGVHNELAEVKVHMATKNELLAALLA